MKFHTCSILKIATGKEINPLDKLYTYMISYFETEAMVKELRWKMRAEREWKRQRENKAI